MRWLCLLLWSRLCALRKLAGLAGAIFFCGASHSPGATFSTLLTNGTASNRLCFVFLSEGYTNAQSSLFLTDCTNTLHAFFGGGSFTGEDPFLEYGNYFNAYAIFTNSIESGADHPHPYYSTFKNTYFNCSYDPYYDYVITNDATGQSRVNTLLNSLTPTNQFRYRLPILLVNDPVVGGSGGQTLIMSTAVLDPSWADFGGIPVHESGHVLANLGDEYESYANGGDFMTITNEPNTTQATNLNAIPWKVWIETNTPIPTPNQLSGNPYFNDVGLFEGAHYSPTNWYRPKLNCRMRSVALYGTGLEFCEVCREALVKSFYAKVRAIDAVSPTNAALTLTTTQAVAFSVMPLQPRTHNLAIQWQTNGVSVVGATNTAFAFDPRTVTNGTYTLRAVVRDDTAWVRNDPTGLLSATNMWNLTVAIPQLWLESPQALMGGKFRFTVRGSAVTNFTIKASTNLTTWSSIATNALSGGQFNFTNSGLTTIPWRFYRAVSPPQ